MTSPDVVVLLTYTPRHDFKQQSIVSISDTGPVTLDNLLYAKLSVHKFKFLVLIQIIPYWLDNTTQQDIGCTR